MMQLSENIRRLRRARGLSQEELANRLNVSRQSVSLWEQGVTNPTVENIYAMAEVLGASFDDLLGESSADTPTGTPLVARSFEELMREGESAGREVSVSDAEPASEAEVATGAEFVSGAAPTTGEASPAGAALASNGGVSDSASWEDPSVPAEVRAEARYYRYRRTKRGMMVGGIIVLSGVALFVVTFIWAGFASIFPSVWSDFFGGLLVLLSLPIILGGLVTVIVSSIRASRCRRQMGDLFDLAVYEELKRGTGQYATRRKP